LALKNNVRTVTNRNDYEADGVSMAIDDIKTVPEGESSY
jgi:hypothetical protein